MRDPDIWWHLADARQLMTTHHFIWTEPNSFTVGGQPWVNPEWLSELPYWFGYQALHLRGIYFAESVSFLRQPHSSLLARIPKVRSCRRRMVGRSTCLLVNLGERAFRTTNHLCGVSGNISSEYLKHESYKEGKTRSLWLLPPLFCIWINLHGSWLIGLALFVLFILCGSFEFKMGAIEQEPFSRPELNRLLTVLAVCVGALMINPYGWHLIWNPIDMMANQKLNIANVMEWKPLSLSTAAGVSAFAAMCLMVITNALKGRKWRIYELAFVFFAWYAALDHMRFAFLAAVIVTPIIAVDIQRGFDGDSDEKTIPAANAFMVVAAALVILFIFPSEKNLREKLGTFFPMQTLEEIQPSWRTFDSDTVGGMMSFLRLLRSTRPVTPPWRSPRSPR